MTEVVCSAGCKRTAIISDDGTLPAGFEQLSITGRYRCSHCWRELTAANHIPGTPSSYEPDPLPADSIGSLKKFRDPPPLREEVKS